MPNYRSLLIIKSHPMNYSEIQLLHEKMAKVSRQIARLNSKMEAAKCDAKNYRTFWLLSGMAKGFEADAARYAEALKNRRQQYAGLSSELLESMKPPVQKPAPVWSGNRITAKTVAA